LGPRPRRAPPRPDQPPRKAGSMLWTILVIVVIILAVVGFFTLVRGRA
jgi:hypothetical protein